MTLNNLERLDAKGPIFPADLRKVVCSHCLLNGEQSRDVNPREKGHIFMGSVALPILRRGAPAHQNIVEPHYTTWRRIHELNDSSK